LDQKNKIRIYDIAKQYKISSDALLKVLRGLGFTIKSHMSVAPADVIDAIEQKFKQEIEEVKKDTEARTRKLQELEAKKRREEAEKLALRKKAEAIARKKKAFAEKRARERAAVELAKAKEEAAKAKEKKEIAKKETGIKEPVSKPAAKGKPIRAGKPEAKTKSVKAAPEEKIRPAVKEPVREAKETTEKVKPKKKAKKAAEEPEVKVVSRGRPDKSKLKDVKNARTGVGEPRPRRRRKRDKKKRVQKVDKAAVKLSFKQTMASLDGTKKTKKIRKRVHGEEVFEDSAPTIEITEFMTLSELAKQMDKRPAELVAKCMELGMLASINQRLDMDTIELLAAEFGFNIMAMEDAAADVLETEDETNLQSRSPVVTIMGHVDHGKTTLLDYLRHSNIVSTEAGKITQHIGAYVVSSPGKDGDITFLDTPGHEAFSAMRARGAQVTDIVILIVSAVEAVMPQTIEAIDHARVAGVPIIVAINKIDLPNSNPEAVRQKLANYNLLDETWGGKTIMVEISAKTGQGVEKLLEMILLQAEMMELKADPDIKPQGTVIEARLEKGRGAVATVLVQKGTLKPSVPFVVGSHYGRVRAMIDDRGNNIDKAGPSFPVQVTGLSGVPQAGDPFMVTADETEARNISLKRHQIKQEFDIRRSAPMTLESAYQKIKDGQISDLNIIIKGDVAGSVEALSDILSNIGNEEVRCQIIHSGVGAINDSDVLMAAASNAIIVGFHVTADTRARETAIREKVEIRTYSVIYEVKEDITGALEGMLKPEMQEEWTGTAEVREVFRIPKIGLICGSYVQQGTIQRGGNVRISRSGIVIHEGTISSLKRFKDDTKEVSSGLECGIGIENFNDIKVGDMIETYKMIATERKLQQK
jgi:translation initiation factor IF-2